MRRKTIRSFWVLACFCGLSAWARAQSSGGPSDASSMKPIAQSELCITEGKIEQSSGSRLSVSAPKMRAFVAGPTLQEVEARFTYRGPTKESSPLVSGELRRQFGLKLRAQNGCNLVYAMWRLEPQSELVISVKSNPGMTKSSECDAHGYHTVKPTRDLRVPVVKRGQHYTMRAIIDGRQMRVFANNKAVWEGTLGSEALTFDGPVGVRSDNGRFDFELFAAKPQPGQQGASAACQAGSEEE